MPRIATPEQWRAERIALLEREKELTRLSDELAAQRQALPWVPVEKEYVFDTPDGPATLAELFAGRSQLLVYHFMMGPEAEVGCPSCSSVVDGMEGPHVHLEHHDVAFVAVARAPLERVEAYRRRMGWTARFASSHGSDFNVDFGVSSTEERPLLEYNYAPVADGGPIPLGERPGMSAFAQEDGAVFHAYSSYARGLDALWPIYPWLDRAPKGRNEPTYWHRRRDEYAVTRV